MTMGHRDYHECLVLQSTHVSQISITIAKYLRKTTLKEKDWLVSARGLRGASTWPLGPAAFRVTGRKAQGNKSSRIGGGGWLSCSRDKGIGVGVNTGVMVGVDR